MTTRAASVTKSAVFSEHLRLIMKFLAMSRGQLASGLAVDKSIVSRWLSGATVPSDHNLTRLTAYIARAVPGFTMFDWERDAESLSARLGFAAQADEVLSGPGGEPILRPGVVPDHAPPISELPPFARLAAFGPARHETSARGSRYCGLWRAWMPTVGRPDLFHCEHTALWQDGPWLAGFAQGVSYRWPLVGFIANGQLVLMMSDVSDFVLRQFNRTDEPIVDQVDGLMLAAASLPHQAPTACRVIMARVLGESATRDEIDAALTDRAVERRFLSADELPDGMAASLLPDSGPTVALNGGERLLRADPTRALIKTRWF